MTVNEWLNGNQLSIDIWNNKYRYKDETLDQWFKRVSGGDENIERLIREKKFLFGGRTLSNRGTDKEGSFSNCYSHGFVNDSLEDIMSTAHNIAMTFKAQGGQGLSLSKIRPKGALIHGQFKSDGIIPFMEIFNRVTESISQGGSRKGALLMSLDIWHPEAKDFITIKSDLNKINKANLSLEIDDAFMEAVKNGVTEKECTFYYKDEVFGYTVNPVELFDLLCTYACKYAEPGVIFTDRFRNYNLMEFVPEYQIETCNPCGEQPLPRHGACNLSSINVSEYVLYPYLNGAYFDWDSLKNDISYIVRAMDDVLEENLEHHALEQQREMAWKYRNIGIGIMGLADALIKLGISYDSREGIAFAKELMRFLFRYSLLASAKLAEERGNFPGYNSKVWDSSIIANNFNEEEVIKLREINHLRNCSLISIAPTGSIGTMLNISTGCEPEFMLSYKRRTESLNGKETWYDVEIPIVKEYKEVTGDVKLPNYFVTAEQISWENRVTMQAALQEACDTAISSTVNLPAGTTPEDIKGIYIKAWEQGLKGITVYVDGSRDAILSANGDKKEIKTTVAKKRPKELEADFHLVKANGEQFIVLVGLLDNKPYEVFAFKPNLQVNLPNHKGIITKESKMHYRFASDNVVIPELELANINVEERATTLYASMLLRHNVDIKYIIKTAKKVNSNITSFTSAVCRVLSKYMSKEITGDKCPECGADIIKEGGCEHCSQCLWSRCE